MKIVKKIAKTIGIAFLCLIVIYSSLAIWATVAGLRYTDDNIAYQNQHLEYLETEYYVNYTPCDEQALADFDIQQAVDNGVKYNEISVIGTHNSYQLLTTVAKRVLMKAVELITFGAVDYTKAEFEMDTLTQQFENGVRNIEIDIQTKDDGEQISFIVTHDPILDNVTSCYDFEKMLKEVKMWSDANPNHMPISILIEPKGSVPGINNLKSFSVDYANELDAVIRKNLGDKLITPSDMMGDYETFKDMRLADDWLTLGEMQGKIVVLMHPCDVTQDYIMQDESVKTQAMFPMLRFDSIDMSYASFILDNDPENAIENNKKTIDECNLMVRTRADDFPDFSDERYANADVCGSQIITTDYPPKTMENENHVYNLDGYMIKLLK